MEYKMKEISKLFGGTVLGTQGIGLSGEARRPMEGTFGHDIHRHHVA